MKFNVLVGVLFIIAFSFIGFYFAGDLLNVIESLIGLNINCISINEIFLSKLNMMLLLLFNSLVSFLFVYFIAKETRYLKFLLGVFTLSIISGFVIILKLRLTYDYMQNLNDLNKIKYSSFTFLILPIFVNTFFLLIFVFQRANKKFKLLSH